MNTSKAVAAKQNAVLAFLMGNLVWVVLVALVVFALVTIPIFKHPINLTNILKQSIGLGIAVVRAGFRRTWRRH